MSPVAPTSGRASRTTQTDSATSTRSSSAVEDRISMMRSALSALSGIVSPALQFGSGRMQNGRVGGRPVFVLEGSSRVAPAAHLQAPSSTVRVSGTPHHTAPLHPLDTSLPRS
jgi:hypothetical protein